MAWRITEDHNWGGGPVHEDRGLARTTPEAWLKDNMPGVLNTGSLYKVGMEIKYTISYANGDETVVTFTKES